MGQHVKFKVVLSVLQFKCLLLQLERLGKCQSSCVFVGCQVQGQNASAVAKGQEVHEGDEASFHDLATILVVHGGDRIKGARLSSWILMLRDTSECFSLDGVSGAVAGF